MTGRLGTSSENRKLARRRGNPREGHPVCKPDTQPSISQPLALSGRVSRSSLLNRLGAGGADFINCFLYLLLGGGGGVGVGGNSSSYLCHCDNSVPAKTVGTSREIRLRKEEMSHAYLQEEGRGGFLTVPQIRCFVPHCPASFLVPCGLQRGCCRYRRE